MKYKAALAVLTRRKAPIRVQHICTYKCNLRCKYCGYWKKTADEMSTDEVKRCMDEFADAGTISWGFTGGEPILRQDILELIDHAKSRGMSVSLLSNGILLDKFAPKLHKVDSIFVSLDGSREMNDSIRGKGTFDKAVNSIKKVKAEGIDVGIQATLSRSNLKDNAKELRYLMNLCKELDCKFVVSPIYESSVQKPSPELMVDGKKMFLEGIQAIRDFKKENPKLVSISNAALDWFETYGDKGVKWKCYAGKYYCQVFPDGKMAPCHFLLPQALDGRKLGYVNAFNQFKDIKDCVCWCNCYVEYNLLSSLKPNALLNAVTHFGRMVK